MGEKKEGVELKRRGSSRKENERMNFYRLSSLMANFNMMSLSIHYRPLRTDYDPYNT